MNKLNRILLKVSGEQLSGTHDSGIDTDLIVWLAGQVKPLVDEGKEVVIMVGGGNFARGAQLAGNGIKRVTADQIGMLATMLNALALTDVFEASGIKTRCLTTVFAAQVAEPFVHRLANKHLEKGRVVVVGGGSGRPYVTTDTAAVVLALELDCQAVLKATNVDGVYNLDPNKQANATKYEHLSHQDAVSNEHVRVMDRAALGLALEQQMPIVVYNFNEDGALRKIVDGEAVGTKIS